MKKLKELLFIIWLGGALLCTALGFLSIVKFDIGLLTLIFTIGTVFILVHLNLDKIDKETKKILLQAEELYSLDFENLQYIKKIELNNRHEYFVVLTCDLRFKLENSKIPHTQFDLKRLDESYESISNRVKISNKEIS